MILVKNLKIKEFCMDRYFFLSIVVIVQIVGNLLDVFRFDLVGQKRFCLWGFLYIIFYYKIQFLEGKSCFFFIFVWCFLLGFFLVMRVLFSQGVKVFNRQVFSLGMVIIFICGFRDVRRYLL